MDFNFRGKGKAKVEAVLAGGCASGLGTDRRPCFKFTKVLTYGK